MIAITDASIEADGTPAALGDAQDSALAAAAARDDRKALAELVRRHARAVYAVCSQLAVAGEVHDTTQEALEKIVTKVGSYDAEKGSFRSWSLAIARHTCIDRQRRRSLERRTFHADGEAETAAAHGQTPNPEHLALARSDARQLQLALAELPEPMRAAIVMFHVHETSYEDIAAALEVPIGTVMTWLHRGRKRVREALDGSTKDGP